MEPKYLTSAEELFFFDSTTPQTVTTSVQRPESLMDADPCFNWSVVAVTEFRGRFLKGSSASCTPPNLSDIKIL